MKEIIVVFRKRLWTLRREKNPPSLQMSHSVSRILSTETSVNCCEHWELESCSILEC